MKVGTNYTSKSIGISQGISTYSIAVLSDTYINDNTLLQIQVFEVPTTLVFMYHGTFSKLNFPFGPLSVRVEEVPLYTVHIDLWHLH